MLADAVGQPGRGVRPAEQGDQLPAAAEHPVDHGGGGELVTLLSGADAPDGLAEAVREHVGRRWPFVEVQAYPGGQPHYPLLVGVE